MEHVDDILRKIEISDETVLQLKDGKINVDEFCLNYKIIWENSKSKLNEIGKQMEDYESNIIEFKREFVKLTNELENFESFYLQLIERAGGKKYLITKAFEKQVKEYDQQQKKKEEYDQKQNKITDNQ